jgi:uncharacterized RDD family membrane protein YckC
MPGAAPGGMPGGIPGSMPGYGPAPGAGYGPAPGYGPPTGGVGQPADLLPRFLARLLDFLLVGVVNGLIMAVVVVGILGVSSGGTFSGMGMGGNYASGAIGGLVGAAISLAYFSFMESSTGQTVGKMALKIRTVGPDGAPPSLEVAVRRNFWVALGALAVVPVLGGLIGSIAELVIVIMIIVTISQSPVRQGWHDKLAGTRVIRNS